MAVILHAVSLAGVCRKGRSSPVPQVRARPEEMRCVGSKRTRELGRDMLLAASIVESSVAKAVEVLNRRPHRCLGVSCPLSVWSVSPRRHRVSHSGGRSL